MRSLDCLFDLHSIFPLQEATFICSHTAAEKGGQVKSLILQQLEFTFPWQENGQGGT